MQNEKKLLDVIQVASPCHVSWDEMRGDDSRRFCAQCKLNVYNLSAMTGDEAETFLKSRAGNVCIRFYRRSDGTVLTQDCPVGWRLAQRKLVGFVTALSAFITFVVFGYCQTRAKSDGTWTDQGGPFANYQETIEPQPVMGMMAFPAACWKEP